MSEKILHRVPSAPLSALWERVAEVYGTDADTVYAELSAAGEAAGVSSPEELLLRAISVLRAH